MFKSAGSILESKPLENERIPGSVPFLNPEGVAVSFIYE